MSTTNFLCIDDQQDNTPEDFIRVLESYADLKITRNLPTEIGPQIDSILAASANTENFGLLVDLRLDMEAGPDQIRVPYRGTTLAQELRTRLAEEAGYNSFPIILWSINTKFAKSFQRDDTSHDLFDAIYGKDEEINDCPDLVARQMCSLAKGYSRINLAQANNSLNSSLLGLRTDQIGPTTSAFIDHFEFIIQNRAKHDVALHLMSDLIKPAGLLVTEKLLAARFGVDIQECVDDWETLKTRLVATSYTGPFSDAWPRWWWFAAEAWWDSLPDRPANLRRIGAVDRVKFLNEKLGLKLVDAKPMQAGYSTKFFTLCVATGSPIDPADALRAATPMIKPWEDTSFVSIYAALNRIEQKKWRIDPLDTDRFAELKA
jgi:hypothetical protein